MANVFGIESLELPLILVTHVEDETVLNKYVYSDVENL